MSDLSAADIAEGHRLDKAATPGPWDTDPHAHLEKGCRCLCCHDSATVTHTTNMLYCEDIPVPDGADQTRCDQPGYTWSDAELIVWARNHLPALLDAAEKVAALEAKTDSPSTALCASCRWCENEWQRGAYALDPAAALMGWGMIVCPDCGNKRCPKATHHDHVCTGSNEAGQEGSVYGDFTLDTAWLDEDGDSGE
ncbi:hypothetical protein ACFYY5_29210 [Nocardia elegans]|uniref:Uncharacterized protein n=1 Tax=Nocardia elegans TaxID=300029 RepID=A0ABW6TLC8_9NOCA